MIRQAIKQSIKAGFNLTASHFGQHQQTPLEPKLWVLMYHRILPKTDARFALEEPGMVVTPETFDMHLNVAKQLFDIVSLSEWLAKAEKGEPLPAKACAITFDDGWLDNYEFALPLLQKHEIPATLYAVVDKIGTQFKFWPNIIAELIKNKSDALHKHPMLKPALEATKKPFSVEVTAQCIAELKQYSEDEIFTTLNKVQWQQALKNSAPALMDWQQLEELEASGLVELGSHTCTHRRLDKSLANETLEYEIKHSQQILKQRTGKQVSQFCFPNGDYDEHALSLVKSTYKGAVTTTRGINKLSTLKPFELNRIALHEDGSNTAIKFGARLSGWRV